MPPKTLLNSSAILLGMAQYPPESWKRLGSVVALARRKAGYREMSRWASEVKRSTRTLQGLERGEPVGDATLARIEEVLNWDAAYTHTVLAGADRDRLDDQQSAHAEAVLTLAEAERSADLEPERVMRALVGLVNAASEMPDEKIRNFLLLASSVTLRHLINRLDASHNLPSQPIDFSTLHKEDDFDLAARSGSVDPSPTVGRQAAAGEENQDPDGETLD